MSAAPVPFAGLAAQMPDVLRALIPVTNAAGR